MKNVSGKIYRSNKTGKTKYTSIFNDVLQNTKLSFRARGLLSYLLSLPHDWVPVKTQVMKKNEYNKTKFNAIWKELVDAGYIESHREKNDRGQYIGWIHMVYETPSVGNTDNQETLLSGNQDLIKETVLENKEYIKEKDINKDIKLEALRASNATSFSDILYLFPELSTNEQLELFKQL